MTEEILLNEISSDLLLQSYSVVIIDEVNFFFFFKYLKKSLKKLTLIYLFINRLMKEK